ncbi:MAG: glycosyltransferase family A protein [Patescibacteria group bacterium]|nr:glycosyltransferase family A protein [Patescibacteria group bacterium]
MKASVIIRARNEEKWLPTVLKILENQTKKDFEVILVDNESTDKTAEIFRSSKLANKKIVNLPKDQFSYPRAANLGAEQADGDILIYLSGHSVPVKKSFIEGSLAHFKDDKVCGVFGPGLPLPDASKFEKWFYRPRERNKEVIIFKKPRMGLLGMTNAAIRKDLWKEHKFDEGMFRLGGEDIEWAFHYLRRNYIAIFEPRMIVRHSHGKKLFPAFIKQYIHWAYIYWKAKIFNFETSL